MNHDPPDAGSNKDTIKVPERDDAETQIMGHRPGTAETGEQELPDRYTVADLLGEGGMGRVWLCRDDTIGRRVALKVLQDDYRDVRSAERFVQEARVQGRLEHPSVVPVYDLDADDAEAPFFTMKRVQGETLDQVLRQQRKGSGGGDGAAHSQRRLLTAFSQVCLAVDYAHRRGVLHRDIKPSNIMLGEFGEVYLLDWGLARIAVRSKDDAPAGPALDTAEFETDDLAVSLAKGDLLGTPAYMSPEHMQDLPQASDPQADVFSLGAVLFEILTLERLNPAGPVLRILARGMAGLDARASVRAPRREVPAELEAICVRATAKDPADRFPTARALQEAVEAFLDGVRDEELRRDLSARHAARAAGAMDRATDRMPMEARREVMGAIGQALALDPGNRQALDALTRLMTRPPDELPPEVEDRVQRTFEAQWRWSSKVAGVAYLSVALFLPLFFWSGVTHVPAVAVFFGLAMVSCALAFSVAWARRPRVGLVLAAMGASTLCYASTMTLFGPLFVTPGLIASNTAAYIMLMRGWHRTATIAFGCLCMGGVILAEALGVPWSAYIFTDGGMAIRQGAVGLAVAPTITLLICAALSTILTSALSVSRLRDALTLAEQQVQLQAWQVRQLIPAISKREERVENMEQGTRN